MRKMLCVVVTSMGILFANCNSPVFTPIASPNPWQDNYSFLSSMDNYRLWGTYNVHDPSCRKLGDYYYIIYRFGKPRYFVGSGVFYQPV